jgi:hypothetical protein
LPDLLGTEDVSRPETEPADRSHDKDPIQVSVSFSLFCWLFLFFSQIRGFADRILEPVFFLSLVSDPACGSGIPNPERLVANFGFKPLNALSVGSDFFCTLKNLIIYNFVKFPPSFLLMDLGWKKIRIRDLIICDKHPGFFSNLSNPAGDPCGRAAIPTSGRCSVCWPPAILRRNTPRSPPASMTTCGSSCARYFLTLPWPSFQFFGSVIFFGTAPDSRILFFHLTFYAYSC